MLSDDTRRKIENITNGVVLSGFTDNCTSLRNLLIGSYPTSTTVKTDFASKSVAKKEQEILIEEYCVSNNLFHFSLPGPERFLTRGGEANVYLSDDGMTVIKVNDGVYYATWLEYLNSVLLHNLIFTNTAYTLTGFCKIGSELMAVLTQPFVRCDGRAESHRNQPFFTL